MTNADATELVAILAEAYPREPVTDRRAQVFAALLADLELDRALAAVARVMSRSRFFPTVAEIREEYARAELDAPLVETAWAEVLREVRRVGYVRAPRFSDPRIAEAVEAVGWLAICRSTTPGVERAHFARALDAICDRQQRDHQAPPFARSAGQRRRLPAGPSSPLGSCLALLGAGGGDA